MGENYHHGDVLNHFKDNKGRTASQYLSHQLLEYYNRTAPSGFTKEPKREREEEEKDNKKTKETKKRFFAEVHHDNVSKFKYIHEVFQSSFGAADTRDPFQINHKDENEPHNQRIGLFHEKNKVNVF